MKINTVRKKCQTDECEVKYYEDLDFVDLFDELEKLNSLYNKKKSIDPKNKESYSVAYFKDGKVIRIDYVGGAFPSETYILWEEDKVKEAYKFYIGYKFGKKYQININ
jgi:hypothetical protein